MNVGLAASRLAGEVETALIIKSRLVVVKAGIRDNLMAGNGGQAVIVCSRRAFRRFICRGGRCVLRRSAGLCRCAGRRIAGGQHQGGQSCGPDEFLFHALSLSFLDYGRATAITGAEGTHESPFAGGHIAGVHTEGHQHAG